MKAFLLGKIRFLRNTALATATLGAFLLSTGAPHAVADADDCQRRVVRADHRLHEAAEHHGWNSPQATHARQELRQARERCWNRFHRWWSEDDRRWHTERDWDDHDHDRDRDHDHH